MGACPIRSLHRKVSPSTFQSQRTAFLELVIERINSSDMFSNYVQ